VTERGAPTLDRMVLGLIAGAVTGALLVAVAYTFFLGTPSFDLGMLPLAGFLGFVLLLPLLPMTQPLIWFVLRVLRLPDWLASTIAGGIAFAAIFVLVTLCWNSGYGTGGLDLFQLLSWTAMGLVVGLVIWRVTSFDL
jgi:hypothetical protein